MTRKLKATKTMGEHGPERPTGEPKFVEPRQAPLDCGHSQAYSTAPPTTGDLVYCQTCQDYVAAS